MALSNTARFLIAGIFAAVIVVVALVVGRPGGTGGGPPGDVETTVVLDDDGTGRCRIVNKEDKVTIQASRKLTWIIDEDDCDYKNEIVTVGNFRETPDSTAPDCSAAVQGGAVWPFVENETDPKHRQNTTNPTKIELHVKPSGALPGTRPTVEYYYDICTGERADVKSDPLLVIEK